MKKLLSIFLLTLILSCTTTKSITGKYKSESIFLDPLVVHGVLDNKLEYFIRPNSEPQNRIELRLVIDAGSILEDEDQLGLAHLIEHMAFNGTTKFKKHRIIDFLESTGMSFGADINAYTSFDETVYKINIPADDPEILETGLSILKEWAFEIAFEDEEVDKERGVVVEEWRYRRDAGDRMREKYFPVLFSDSRYASRLPIGDMDIVKNSSYETIKRFYRDWYRPELMAVMVVGDIDTVSVIQQIEELFGSYMNPDNTRVRTEFTVPDNSKNLYSIVTDPEASSTNLHIMYKNDSKFVSTTESYRTYIINILGNIIFGQRLNELTSQSEPPYIYAYAGTGKLVRTKSVFSMNAMTSENGVAKAFETLIEENERFMRFGFTASEFERAKKELLGFFESSYIEKDKTDSAYFIEELVSFYLDGTPAPGISWEWEAIQLILSELTLEDLVRNGQNLRAVSKPIVIVTGSDKESVIYPDESFFESSFKKYAKQEIEVYDDSIDGSNLMDTPPAPGSIIDEAHDAVADFYIWTLSNGSKVVFKNTDFKNNELLFSASSPGGSSLIEDADYLTSTMASNIVHLSGLGDFNEIDIEKLLAGKPVSVDPYIDDLYEGFYGSSVIEGAESMFQLINLYFTNIRRDDIAFDSFMNRMKGFIENRESDPEVIFYDKLEAALYNEHFRSLPLTVSRLDEIDKNRAYDIFEARFSNPADFTFFFVGNLPDDFRALVETYIASIPGETGKEKWIDRKISLSEGLHNIEVYEGIEEKSSVDLIFPGSYDWTLENNMAIYALEDLLNIRLREEIREESSGTYGVDVSASLNRFPVATYILSINFSCDPDRVDELVNLVFEVIDEVRTSLADNKNIVKIKEGFNRDFEESIRENGYWLELMELVFEDDLESSYILDEQARVDTLSADIIRDAAITYLDTENYFKAVLYPDN